MRKFKAYDLTKKMTALTAALILSAVLFSGCAVSGGSGEKSSAASSVTSVDTADDTKSVTEDASDTEAQESSNGTESSSDTENQESVQAQSETSDESDTRETSDNNSADESGSGSESGSGGESGDASDISGENGASAPEDSESTDTGYVFEVRDIVEDYHNAEKFTDDEQFNALFEENDIDKAYIAEQKETEEILQMRKTTIRYAGIWKNEADEAYGKLYDMLSELPEEREKLVASQQEWESELETIEEGFRQEGGDAGTYGLLAADSAIMNYYKGRAAVLYHQIYLLSGSFDMN